MADSVLKMMKENDVEFVDLRFTDPRGKLQHVTFDKSMVDEDFFTDGQMFMIYLGTHIGEPKNRHN